MIASAQKVEVTYTVSAESTAFFSLDDGEAHRWQNECKNGHSEDENEYDELENVDSSLKTKDGYLKDNFVVSDCELLNYDSELSEESYN